MIAKTIRGHKYKQIVLDSEHSFKRKERDVIYISILLNFIVKTVRRSYVPASFKDMMHVYQAKCREKI